MGGAGCPDLGFRKAESGNDAPLSATEPQRVEVGTVVCQPSGNIYAVLRGHPDRVAQGGRKRRAGRPTVRRRIVDIHGGCAALLIFGPVTSAGDDKAAIYRSCRITGA